MTSASDGRCAELVRELGAPAPFSLAELRTRLETYCGHAVRIVPAAMRAGAPTGVWLRTDGAECLYVERRTSAFHQAHIVLHATAHMVLGCGARRVLDTRLVPDVSQDLIRFILGDTVQSAVSDQEADLFAFLMLEGQNPSLSRRSATKLVAQLRPLHTALLDVVPSATCSAADDAGTDSRRELYRAVIAIRDAALALRPYREPRLAAAAAVAAARAAGLAGDELAVTVHAIDLAHAVHAKMTDQGGRAESEPWADDLVDAAPPTLVVPDLGNEAEWLAAVSCAFQIVSAQIRGHTFDR